MKNKAFRFSGIVLVLSASLLTACDPFQDDFIDGEQFVFNPAKQTVYYILPNSSTVIDLKFIIQKSFISLNLSVTAKPALGELSKLTDFILKYEPNPDFIEGHDRFVYSVNAINGSVIETDTVYIIMRQDVSEFPCSLIAVEDFVSVKPGSQVSINFLDYDRICGVHKENLGKLIYSKPQHGTATITGDVISYTAHAGYEGWEQFVYEISGEVEDSVVTAFGLISILIAEDTCRFVVSNDVYTVTINSSTQDVLEFYILANDIICSGDPLQFMASIVQQPKYGTAEPIDGGKIHYEKTSPFTESYKDSLVYRLCHRGDCQQGVVVLDFEEPQCSMDQLWQNIAFIDETTALSWCPFGIYQSNDFGKNWNKITSLPNEALTIDQLSFYFYSTQTFAAHGGCIWNVNRFDCTNGRILTTTDGGSSWKISSISQPVTTINFISPSIGLMSTSSYAGADGINTIYKTYDGGATWVNVEGPIGGISGFTIRNINSIGYAVAFGMIYKSTNAGDSWTHIYSYPSSTFWMGIFGPAPISEDIVCVSFFNLGIVRTENGGVDWLLTYPHSSIVDIVFSPSKNLGIAIGIDGTVVKSQDKGLTWNTVTELNGLPIRRCLVPSDKFAYVWTDDGKIIKYTNP